MPYANYADKLKHNIEYGKLYKQLNKLPPEYYTYLKGKTNCCVCNLPLIGLTNKHPDTDKIGIDILCLNCYNNRKKLI